MGNPNRERRRSALRRKRQRARWKKRFRNFIIFLIVVAAIVAVVFAFRGALNHYQRTQAEKEAAAEAALMGSIIELDETNLIGTEAEGVVEEAEKLIEQYDYDGAIEYIENSEYYESTPELQSIVADYREERDACVSWAPEKVTHIFFHTLIVDPAKAFDGDSDSEGYNQYMCTIEEFNRIIETMYEEGYVMVSMHDMVETDENGKVTSKNILLPEGKTPFVLSEDDVSYYHYMTGDGFADKLIIDENGKVKNTYTEDDGTVSVGDYDVVPIIDSFVEEHPDFAYHGHKGTIALTGYEGVLGYRTDEVYLTREEGRVSTTQQDFFDANPDFDEAAWQNEVDQATAVANAMKAEGWEFASHTWGHIDPLKNGFDAFKRDCDRWEANVRPIVGDTDIIIFAFGADIDTVWRAYSDSNEYFEYLKELGFNIYCCVDSTKNLVIVSDDAMRMGRRDIDGYRMFYNPGLLSDLFDVNDIWDERRPGSVAPI